MEMEWIHIDPPILPFTEVEKHIRELMAQGKSVFQIAYRLHISTEACRDAIFEIRKKECLMAGKPKLTEEQMQEVFRLYNEEKLTQCDIAARFGISKSSVGNIVTRYYKKKTGINEDFDTAVDSMIAESKSENAEPETVITEPAPKDKLPEAVYRALLDKLNDCAFEIEQREQRIAELQAEIAEYEQIRKDIIEWKEPYEK